MYILDEMKTTTIRKWGNSYAIRIPIEDMEKLNLKDGQAVTVSRVGRGLTITPSVARPQSLKEMLARVTPDSIHKEIDWGKAVGKEIW